MAADELGFQAFITPATKNFTVYDLLETRKADFEQRKILSAQNRSGIKLAQEAFGHIRAVAFDPTQVNAYIERQLADGYANATINRTTGLVEQAFSIAVKEGSIPVLRSSSAR